MKILCIGDSNTYGYDPRSYLGSRYPEEVRWTDRLKAAGAGLVGADGAGLVGADGAGVFKSEGTGEWDVVNAGMNGMTAARARASFAGRIRMEDPDLVIVMLGTNDILVGYDPEETAERIDVLVKSIKSTGKQVLLIAPANLKLGEWVPSEGFIGEIQYLGELLEDVAEDNDCYFANAGKWDIELTYDGVHFAEEGHITFADKLIEGLKRI